MYGWNGRTLIIDLTDHKIKETKSDINGLHTYIGGRGIGINLYSDLMKPDIDPLSPENILFSQ